MKRYASCDIPYRFMLVYVDMSRLDVPHFDVLFVKKAQLEEDNEHQSFYCAINAVKWIQFR